MAGAHLGSRWYTHLEVCFEGVDGLGTPWDQGSVLAKTGELHRHVILKHVIDIALVRVFPVNLPPAFPDLGDLCYSLQNPVVNNFIFFNTAIYFFGR